MKKKIYLNGSYLSPKEQIEVFGEDYEISNTYNIHETDIQLGRFFWGKYLWNNLKLNLSSTERKKSDIQIYNSILGVLFYDMKKINILILHGYDIGIGTELMVKNTSSPIKKIILCILNFILGRYIRRQIRKFDYIYASTYDRYLYIQKHISDRVIFLPNPIDIADIHIQKNPKNNTPPIIFCPERAEINKGLEKRKEIILNIRTISPESQFLFLDIGADIEGFRAWVRSNNINATWIGFLAPDELYKNIQDSDIVLGIFNNGALSITNLEVMLLKKPLITYDARGSIKNTPEDLDIYTKRMILDQDFRNAEVQRNHRYVTETHSLRNYRSIIKI